MDLISNHIKFVIILLIYLFNQYIPFKFILINLCNIQKKDDGTPGPAQVPTEVTILSVSVTISLISLIYSNSL